MKIGKHLYRQMGKFTIDSVYIVKDLKMDLEQLSDCLQMESKGIYSFPPHGNTTHEILSLIVLILLPHRSIVLYL